FGNIDENQLISYDGDCDDLGESDVAVDCDDTEASVYPGASEIWYDGIDQNCDGLNDYDQDQDGYIAIGFEGNEGGTAPFNGDCNDTDSEINPDGDEIPEDGIDQDCNGFDAVLCYIDADEDSFGNIDENQLISYDGDCDDLGESDVAVDCDDTEASVYPGASEIWYDGIDQNCDGLNDYDQDLDGFIALGFEGNEGGTAPNTGDCDDTDSEINPDATETWYDGTDQNCDELNDYDQDLDGFIALGFEGNEGGTAPNIGDCDDTDSEINPDATETWYDGIDQNCDELNDYDQDLDGFIALGFEGNEGGTAPNTGDCNDTNNDINPDATEICDNIDNNCNDETDEELEVIIDYGGTGIYCDYEEASTPNIFGPIETLGGIFTSTPEGLDLNSVTGDINVANSLPNLYTITYTSPNPCLLSANMEIDIRSVNVSVTENSPSLTANEDIAYYQWIDCFDDSFITDETNQSFTATEDGSYAVIVTQWGCTDTSACYDIFVS
ncbi:MAG: hypothetical protein C0596_08375, partial [Marinilabiliales bacterium]